jgi:hypothetical protein
MVRPPSSTGELLTISETNPSSKRQNVKLVDVMEGNYNVVAQFLDFSSSVLILSTCHFAGPYLHL